jgi:hypothetical protein
VSNLFRSFPILGFLATGLLALVALLVAIPGASAQVAGDNCVALGTATPGAVSFDAGRTWSSVGIAGSGSFSDATWQGSTWVAATYSSTPASGHLWTSAAGTSWNAQTHSSRSVGHLAVDDTGVVVATATNQSTSGPLWVLRSGNGGFTWTDHLVDASVSSNPKSAGITFVNGAFVIVEQDLDKAWSSTDGQSWSAASAVSPSSLGGQDVQTVGSLAMVRNVGGEGGLRSQFYGSFAGSSWVLQGTIPATNDWHWSYNGDLMLASGGPGTKTWTSDDGGGSWTQSTASMPGGGGWGALGTGTGEDLRPGNGTWVALTGSTALFTEDDGEVWEPVSGLPGTHDWNVVSCDGVGAAEAAAGADATLINVLVPAVSDLFGVSLATGGTIVGAVVFGMVVFVVAKRGPVAVALVGIGTAAVLFALGMMELWVVVVAALLALAFAAKRLG